MKYSLDISNFLEEISSLSHSVVFPSRYNKAMIHEEVLFVSWTVNDEGKLASALSGILGGTQGQSQNLLDWMARAIKDVTKGQEAGEEEKRRKEGTQWGGEEGRGLWAVQ